MPSDRANITYIHSRQDTISKFLKNVYPCSAVSADRQINYVPKQNLAPRGQQYSEQDLITA